MGYFWLEDKANYACLLYISTSREAVFVVVVVWFCIVWASGTKKLYKHRITLEIHH